jgi:TonB-linked SusC/RagA family outer membrane protein
VTGTRTAVTSDANGNFTISVPENGRLDVSATGYAPQTLSVAGNSVSPALVRAEGQLQEVVVTALGIRREKKALGYAVQSVDGEDLTIAKSTDVSNSLAGKVAGVQLQGSPSSTFDNANILIRGVTGLGPQPPIFVVDGTITDQSAVIMDNVESLSVLKGPAATALYGQRAGNGVVVITSKKGSRRKSSGVELNLGVTRENLSVLPPYQNQYAGGYTSAYTSKNTLGAGYLDDQGYYIFNYDPSIHPPEWAAFQGHRMLEYGADESWGPKIDGSLYRPYYSWYPGDDFGKLVPMTAQPDNVKNFFQKGYNLNNSIAFTSGAENYNFRLTYANQNRSLIIPGAKRDQHQVGLNGSYDIGSRINLSTDMTYTTARTKGQPLEGYRLDGLNVTQNFNQWFQRQLDFERMKTYRQPDGSLNSWNIGDPNATGDFAEYSIPQYWDNPYFVIKENYGTQFTNRLVGNAGLNLKFNPQLNLQSYVRMSQSNSENDFRVATGGLQLDEYSINQHQFREMNYETNLTYRNKFGAFSVDGLLGGNIRNEFYSRLAMRTEGGLSAPNFFDISASVARPTVNREDYRRKRVNSIYGKAGFGYKDMLFLEGTLRNDWSSALPKENNSYLYPSLSTSFVFTELLKNSNLSNWLTFGKVRASFASVGSDIDFNQVNVAIGNGSLYGSNPSVAIGNQFRSGNIKPALTKAYEVGAEFRFFKRIGFDIAVYQNNSIDQIIPLDVSPTSGFSTAQVNAGNIQSKGIEVTLSGAVIAKSDFNWDVTLNWAKNSNFVKELAPGLNTYLYGRNRFDIRLEHRVGAEWGQYVGRKWKTNENGKTVILANGLPDYDINQDIGNVLADWTGGMFQTVRYKNFDLAFSVDFQKGGLFYSETRNFNTGSGLSEETVGVNDKGNDCRDYPGTYTLAGGNTGMGGIRIPGEFADKTVNNRYIPARSYWYTARQRDAGNVLLDGSYIKLREVRFGYGIPKSFISKIGGIKTANFGIIVSNAWLIWANTKKYGVDPSELEVFHRELKSWIITPKFILKKFNSNKDEKTNFNMFHCSVVCQLQ